MTLYIFRGNVGSGKSTKAWELQFKLFKEDRQFAFIVERDMIRMELFNKLWTGDHEDEKKVSDVQYERIKSALNLGISVICSDTNLQDRGVRQLIGIAFNAGVPVELIEMRDVPLEVCIEQDRHRGEKTVGEDVIRAKYERFIRGRKFEDLPYEPFKSPNGRVPDFSEVLPYTPPNNSFARQVVLVDMDGTLCNHNGRDPYDDSLYHEDLVFENVRDTVQALHDAGFQIDIMTGRYEKFRDVCTQWLVDNEIPFADLHMRHMDGRDDLVKQLMFEKHYRNNENLSVRFAIDDRDRVVDMYRKVLGLQVFQVNYGDF